MKRVAGMWHGLLRLVRNPEWVNVWARERRRGAWRLPRTVLGITCRMGGLALGRALGGDATPPVSAGVTTASVSNVFRTATRSAQRATRPRTFCETLDLHAIRAYAWAHLPKEVRTICDDAEAIREGWVPLFDGTRQYDLAKHGWDDCLDDPEMLFYLNRWYHGVTLAKAWAYTGRSVHASTFADLLAQWLAAHPCDTSSLVWESYSVSERIVNWLFADGLFAAVGERLESVQDRLDAALAEHAEYLLEHLEDRYVHNHLINNARALFEYGLLRPDLPEASSCLTRGWEILTCELRQFHEDGMLGEQSTHYHLLLTRRYAEVVLLARINGHDMPDEVWRRVRQMFEVANSFVRPDGSLAMFGDVSPDISPRGLTGFLAVGSAHFDVPSSVPPNEAAVWWLGRRGLEAWRPQAPRCGVLLLRQSGYAVARTPDLHLVMVCDPRARVVRHGHLDVLSIDLWTPAGQVLVDPGSSTFQGDAFTRYFRGPLAHSTILVDGLPPYVLGTTLRSLLPSDYCSAEAGLLEWAEDAGRIMVRAFHDGYRRLPDPVRIERTVLLEGNRTVRIVDRIEAAEEHRFQVLFQLGANEAVERTGRVVTIRAPSGTPLARVEFHTPGDATLTVHVGEADLVVLGWFSSGYGSRHPATTLEWSFRARGPVSLETSVALLDEKSSV